LIATKDITEYGSGIGTESFLIKSSQVAENRSPKSMINDSDDLPTSSSMMIAVFPEFTIILHFSLTDSSCGYTTSVSVSMWWNRGLKIFRPRSGVGHGY